MRDEIVAVAARHHASNVRVFGSVATGSDTPSSDLDLLVHFSDEASLYDQVGLTLELRDVLGVSADVVSDGAWGRGPHKARGGCVTAEERTRRALTDIPAFADEISQYVTSLGEQNFYSHRPTQLIAEALLHRIGQAVSRINDGFAAEHPAVEWQKMKGMRNVVAHEYRFVDHRIVWRTLSDVLPATWRRSSACCKILLTGSEVHSDRRGSVDQLCSALLHQLAVPHESFAQ